MSAQVNKQRSESMGSAAVVELGVVGVQVWLYSTSFQQINDVLDVWYKAAWAQNGASLDAAVDWSLES